jgi:imidazolonepropionase-like amidohydrolase
VDSIEHGEDLDEELCQEMVKRGTILVPTLELLTTWYVEFMPADSPVEHIRPEVFLHRDVDDVPDVESGQRYARAVVENFMMAKENGVKIALGSDSVYSPLTPHGEYSAREFRAMVKAGMSPLEAITAATSVGAQALGMAHRVGSIEPGKAADLLVVNKDPTADADVLYDARNIRWIISNGRLAVEDGRLAY